ncbi:MAG: glycosyltransferase family 4 protein [Candidatus Omnitrophica bacterium]|nr:glycosyltransferase family 4 protein [Candidatus Omnitrophota bacterium]
MRHAMKICVISSQMEGFGKIGGFGFMTKKLAVSLAGRGFEVSVVMPRKEGQDKFCEINGIKIYGLSKRELFGTRVFRKIDADIYHSQNPNILSFFAAIAVPQKKHVITCRDPRTNRDWITEIFHATWKRRIQTVFFYLFEGGFPVSYAVKNADVVGVPARFLESKVRNLYGIEKVEFLPNIVDIPEAIPKKSEMPTVCFVGRLDRRKNPERVFELARNFPEIKFYVVGLASDAKRQGMLERTASSIANVEMTGRMERFGMDALERIYSVSRILVNTSVREGLPLTFVEAACHGCAILSGCNPDNFASEFGYWARNNDFEKGLGFLLEKNAWEEKGKKAFDYVKTHYDSDKAIKKHIDIYEKLCNGRKYE